MPLSFNVLEPKTDAIAKKNDGIDDKENGKDVLAAQPITTVSSMFSLLYVPTFYTQIPFYRVNSLSIMVSMLQLLWAV